MKSYRLHCITKNGTNPAYEGARIGVSRVAAKYGATVQHSYPDIPDDIEQQKALLRKALADKPDAILLAPAHPTALNEEIQQVVDQGIPLIHFVSNTVGVAPQTFVTANNYSVAKSIAHYLMDAIGGVGKLVIIEGNPNSPTSPPRTEGFLDAVSERKDVQVVAQKNGAYQKDIAYQAMKEILSDYPDIEGVLCANDYMAMGVMDAMDEAQCDATLIGINAMPDAIKAIRAGRLKATAAYDAMGMACIAAEAAFQWLAGNNVPSEIELPVDIIDATNCVEWDRSYEERPLPDWDRVMANT